MELTLTMTDGLATLMSSFFYSVLVYLPRTQRLQDDF